MLAGADSHEGLDCHPLIFLLLASFPLPAYSHPLRASLLQTVTVSVGLIQGIAQTSSLALENVTCLAMSVLSCLYHEPSTEQHKCSPVFTLPALSLLLWSLYLEHLPL